MVTIQCPTQKEAAIRTKRWATGASVAPGVRYQGVGVDCFVAWVSPKISAPPLCCVTLGNIDRLYPITQKPQEGPLSSITELRLSLNGNHSCSYAGS